MKITLKLLEASMIMFFSIFLDMICGYHFTLYSTKQSTYSHDIRNLQVSISVPFESSMLYLELYGIAIFRFILADRIVSCDIG